MKICKTPDAHSLPARPVFCAVRKYYGFVLAFFRKLCYNMEECIERANWMLIFTTHFGGMLYMKSFRQYAALILAAAITCSAAFTLTGCGSRNHSSEDEFIDSVYTPEVPENPVPDDVPGKEQRAAIGDDVLFDNKISAKLDRVIELDAVNKSSYRVLLCEMTITNNDSKKIDCQTLTHFRMNIDGEDAGNSVRDISAAVLARKYYSRTHSDLKSFNQAIEPGQTLQGYVYVYAPTSWDTMELVYVPKRYYTNDCIIYELDEDRFEHYAEDLG